MHGNCQIWKWGPGVPRDLYTIQRTRTFGTETKQGAFQMCSQLFQESIVPA